jgi:hypothetical protein
MSYEKYNKTFEVLFILFIVILGLYYMFLASNTQMLGEDEAGYLNLAKEFVNLEYKQDPYSISPLTSLFYTIFFFIFGSSLGIAKAVISIFGILTIIMVYLFCRKLDKTSFFGINIFGLASVSLLLTIFYFTHFMFISYTEVPIAFFSILILYFLIDLDSNKKAVLVGTIMALSVYLKPTAIVFPFIFGLFFLLKYIYKKDKKTFKLFFISCIITALFITPLILRNLLLFNYPFIYGLNIFFEHPLQSSITTSELVKSISIPIDFYSLFGLIALFFSILGIVHSLETRNEKILLVSFMFLTFLLIYFISSSLGLIIGDPRYFSVIFPQTAIIGGYFISKATNLRKHLTLILIVFFVYSISISISVALSTYQSQRYPDNYVNALEWIKRNTNKDDLIFTAYGGSLSYYGERKNIWTTIEEFPEVMTTTNSTYIYETLKKYKVSYVLIWRGILAEDWIIPESNIIGVFTYNFVTQVDADKDHFELVYSNQDNFVYKLL